MDTNLVRILKEFEEFKGQFVLTNSHKLERLVAIGDDDTDYYYVTYNGRKLTWNTCVGSLVKLKGKLDDKDYNEFVRLAKINHFDQPNVYMPQGDELISAVAEMNKQHKLELTKLEGADKFLTEVCWDIN